MKKNLLIALLGLTPVLSATAQTTPTIVSDIAPGTPSSTPMCLTVYNNALYFVAQPASAGTLGNWKYDGTAASAAVTTTDGMCAQTTRMTVANNKLYLACNSSSVPGQLWNYNGTGTATVINTAIEVNSNAPMVTLNNKVYFVGGLGPAYGLYSCDATTNVATFTNVSMNNIIPAMVPFNNKIYYVAAPDNQNMELHVYDPVTSTSTQIPSSCPSCFGIDYSGSFPKSLYVADNNKLYYSAKATGEGRELFEISGNNAPVKLTTLYSTNDGVDGAGFTFPNNIIKMGNYIYFGGSDGTSGYELMKLDITTNAVSLVKDINANTNSSYPSHFTAYANKIYFSAITTAAGAEMWSSDGTAAGTAMIADLNSGTGNGVNNNENYLTVFNNKLYFVGNDGNSGVELFRVADPTGIESVSKTGSIKVYPVPATENINFDIDLLNPTKLHVALTDISGRKVFSNSYNKSTAGQVTISIPVQHLPSGIYNYTISSDKGELIGTGNITH